MYQIQFRLGLRPRSRWGRYSAPPDLLAGLRGPTSKGGVEGTGRGEKERRGRDRTPSRSQSIFLDTPLHLVRFVSCIGLRLSYIVLRCVLSALIKIRKRLTSLLF